MQLVAYGAQDIYLTGNPQITFFKVVYRRHTNFSMEAIQQTFNGSALVGGSTVTATISRNGDLVSRLWLDVTMDKTLISAFSPADESLRYFNWTNNTGHALIKDCEIEIGGQRIDKHYDQWLDISNELTDHDESEWIGLNKHHARDSYLLSGSIGKTSMGTRADLDTKLYIPLQFWFCRNPGLALPLIALQYHEVKIKITTRNIIALQNCSVAPQSSGDASKGPQKFELWADYIYLDTDERRRFAQVSHEYLIEQLQREGPATISLNQKLNFNHPVKELIWVVQELTSAQENTTVETLVNPVTGNAAGNSVKYSAKNDYFNYSLSAATTSGANVEYINGCTSYEGFKTAKLQLNGHDRFAKRNASYFRTCQPIQAGHKVPTKHIYCYSFALKPEEHQPSGTCNFSRIDNARFVFEHVGGSASTWDSKITIYAINYNVLRIMSGMGGLAYSN